MIYGYNGTIHGNEQLDVEVYNGTVVAVWFRCMPLAFEQFDVDKDRAYEMRLCHGSNINAVSTVDTPRD